MQGEWGTGIWGVLRVPGGCRTKPIPQMDFTPYMPVVVLTLLQQFMLDRGVLVQDAPEVPVGPVRAPPTPFVCRGPWKPLHPA